MAYVRGGSAHTEADASRLDALELRRVVERVHASLHVTVVPDPRLDQLK